MHAALIPVERYLPHPRGMSGTPAVVLRVSCTMRFRCKATAT